MGNIGKFRDIRVLKASVIIPCFMLTSSVDNFYFFMVTVTLNICFCNNKYTYHII